MKKLLATMLMVVMVCGLTACGGSKGWTDEDFIMKNGDDEVEVKKETVWYGFEGVGYLDDYAAWVDGDEAWEEEFDDEYATNRGLEIGMDMDEFCKLYDVKEGHAVWEVVSGENGEWTEFAAYDKDQDIEDVYDDFSDELYPNIWLDLGYYKDGNKWVAMEDVDVQDVWFCEADDDDFKEVAILSVNFDEDGEVQGISLSHIKYDSTWEEWQGWE